MSRPTFVNHFRFSLDNQKALGYAVIINREPKPMRKMKVLNKGLAKKLVNIKEPCGSPHNKKRTEKERIRWGVSYCDTFSLSRAFGIIMSNALLSYVHYAEQVVIRDDFRLIEKHAKAIREWAEEDAWNGIEPDPKKFGKEALELAKKRYDKMLRESEGKSYKPWKTPDYLFDMKEYRKRVKAFKEFKRKEKAWHEAMTWLAENWHSLWW